METQELEFTGERYLPGAGDAEIAAEHAHRYLVARDFVAGRSVVDVGCGAGYGAEILIGYGDYIGIDVSPESIVDATARYASPTARFLVSDASATGLPGGQYDVATCFEVVEHVEDPESVVREVARLLSPTGIALFSTPDKLEYNASRDQPNPFHPSEMTRDEFEGIVAKNFHHHVLMGQRFTQTSVLFDPDSPTAPGMIYAMPMGHGERPRPMYWYCIASNHPLPQLPPSCLPTHEGRNLGAELVRAVAQLRVYEGELASRSSTYEQQIRRLEEEVRDSQRQLRRLSRALDSVT